MCTQGEKRKNEKNGQKNKPKFKWAKKERVNQAAEESSKDITFTAEEIDGTYNFDSYDPLNAEGNDKCLLFYDWLADSCTTSHIMNMRDAFTTFQPLT